MWRPVAVAVVKVVSVFALTLAGCSPAKPPQSPPSAGAQGATTQANPIANPASASPEEAAQAAAEGWLGLMDTGNYRESWDKASTSFKSALDQKGWEKLATDVRAPLGKLESRLLRSRTFTRTLPGALDGEYVVIKYDTSFEHQASASETITEAKDKNGSWRSSGYFIKPR